MLLSPLADLAVKDHPDRRRGHHGVKYDRSPELHPRVSITTSPETSLGGALASMLQPYPNKHAGALSLWMTGSKGKKMIVLCNPVMD